MTGPSRRLVLAGLAAVPFAARHALADIAPEAPVRGGQLIVGVFPEPPLLTSAITTAGATQAVSGKIFDGLLAVDLDMKPQPSLATSWDVAPDGLTLTFRLRSGVTWHDGKPFTSADVAFSALEVWKKFHGRGRSTYANVTAVETPDPLTAIFKLSRPAPYIIAALVGAESPVIPKHLYEGTDILTNPHNTAPIGTGAFRFVQWERGNYLVLERNPTYWNQPKPYLDRMIYRFLPDPAANMNALETGEVQLITSNLLYNDIGRLIQNPEIEAVRRDSPYSSTVSAFELNLERPLFQDLRVRQAFAHAIDKDFIVKNIQYGYATAVNGPIPPDMPEFYTADVPLYPLDLAKAEELLDAAGHKRGADGVRFTITHDPAPTGPIYLRSAELIRDTFEKIGVKVVIRNQDFPSFLRRVYTDREFDTIHYGAQTGPDPAIGTQRYYWSGSFARGVAFSNGSAYNSPVVDKLLLDAQAELDPKVRRELYVRFQQQVQIDLPRIPTVAAQAVVLKRRNVKNLVTTGDGVLGNFADVFIA